MKNHVIHFQGCITTEQPYTSTTPSLAEKSKKTASMLTRMTKGGEVRLAILASSIKGAIRRAGAEIAFMYQQNKDGSDKPFSLDDHKYSRIGGVKSKGDSDRLSPEDYNTIQSENPLIALFGAGDPFISGSLIVEPAYADHNSPDVIDGVRSDDFLRDPNMLSKLDESNIEEFLAMNSDVSEASKLKKEIVQLGRKMMNEKDANKKAELRNQIKALEKTLSETKLVSTQLPLDGYEAIPTGSKLAHLFRIRQKEDDLIQLGFFLSILDYFAHNPFMGGKRANGCGMVSMEYAVTRTSYGSKEETLGSVSVVPFQGVVIQGDYLEKAMDAFKDACSKNILQFKKVA